MYIVTNTKRTRRMINTASIVFLINIPHTPHGFLSQYAYKPLKVCKQYFLTTSPFELRYAVTKCFYLISYLFNYLHQKNINSIHR